MITLDMLPFLFISMGIVMLALVPCGILFCRFFEKKPVLTLVLCGVIIVVALYVIYFIRCYASDVGWLPPIDNNDFITNLTIIKK